MLVDEAPSGDAWFHEMKFDGYRLGARLAGGKASMLTRRGLDWAERFRPMADELRLLKRRDVYLDEEVVALAPAGFQFR